MPEVTVADKSLLHAFYFIPPFEHNHWIDIIDEIFQRNIYVPYIPREKKDTVCLDIGGNVGFASYFFARHFEKVYALEPSRTHQIAFGNMLVHADIKNVTLLPYALSNKNGKETFFHNQNKTSYTLEKILADGTGKEEVETITIDALVKKLGIKKIDFMKLDIEGSEGLVLTSEGFKNIVPILDAFVFEYHEWANVSIDHIINLLRDLGYSLTKLPTVATVFAAVKI